MNQKKKNFHLISQASLTLMMMRDCRNLRKQTCHRVAMAFDGTLAGISSNGILMHTTNLLLASHSFA